VVATVLLPIWMRRAKHPLIPLELFRSRNFTVVNISTLLIYGSLYVTFYYVGLFQQGTLGYAAAAAGAGGIPGSLFLVFLSRRVGDQQRDLPRRSAARRGAHLRLSHGRLLRVARFASHRRRCHIRELSQDGEPAEHPCRCTPDRCRPRCVDLVLPYRDAHRRGSAPGRGDRQRGRHPQPDRPAARRSGEGARVSVVTTMA